MWIRSNRAFYATFLGGFLVCLTACSCSRAHRPTGATATAPAAGGPVVQSRTALQLIDPKRERPPDPWMGPKGWYVFLEGESLQFDPKFWAVDGDANGEKFVSSGDKSLELKGGNSEATGTVSVPAGGKYLLAVRIGAPLKTEPKQAFTLAMSHEGKQEIDWPLVPHEKSLEDLHGSVFEWLSTEVDLQAGESTITIRSLRGSAAGENQRRIDCLILTADTSYNPDHRDFAPQVYMRITVRDTPKPIALSYPLTTRRVKRGRFTTPLSNGESSGWLNLTGAVAGAKKSVYSFAAQPKVDHADYAIDFATRPDNDHIFRKVNRQGPGVDARFVVPGDVSPEDPPLADFELARQRADLVARLPQISFGKRPVRFPILTTLDTANAVRADELEVMGYLGIDGRSGLLDDTDLANGIVTSRLYNVVFYTKGEHGQLDPDLVRSRRDMELDAKTVAASPNKDRVQHLKLMDEAKARPLQVLVDDPFAQDKFRAWIRTNGFDPLSSEERGRLGPAADRAIRLVADPSTQYPGLYFYSQRFRAFAVADFFGQMTKMAHEVYPPGIRTTQNFSDGAVLSENLYGLANDYFDYYRSGALDVALSEDWTDAGATREFGAWNVALLRAATREKGQPIHMYVIAYSGRRPVEVKIKAMEELSEGAKLLEIYDYMPKYEGGSVGWAESPIMFPAIAELTREIGAAEDVLVTAMPRRAETAIYYSIPGDIWSLDKDSAAGMERMSTYVALRHAQVPVDVVSDDQARRGGLRGYKVVYLPSLQIDRRDVAVLAQWVTAGGTLVLGPGAGSRDEWNRPSRALDDALHLSRQNVQTLQEMQEASAGYCTRVTPQGSVNLEASNALGVHWPSGRVPVVAAKQFLDASAATVLAHFEGANEPAAVTVTRGSGSVILWGFSPGIDYVCDAFQAWKAHDGDEPVHPIEILAKAESVLDPAHPKPDAVRMPRSEVYGVLPFHYSSTLRDFITAPAFAAHVARPVVASVPQVVTAFLEGPDGWAVPLANVTGAPIQKLDVDFSPGRALKGIFSSRLGKLEQKGNGTAVRVSLPLESTDILYGRW